MLTKNWEARALSLKYGVSGGLRCLPLNYRWLTLKYGLLAVKYARYR